MQIYKNTEIHEYSHAIAVIYRDLSWCTTVG